MKTHRYRINGNEYDVAVNSISSNKAEVTVNGVTYQVDIEDASPVTAKEDSDESCQRPPQVHKTSMAEVTVQDGKTVNSPLPGIVLGVKVQVGDTVRTGQVVAVLEAMKMENEIQSEFDGVITAVNVSAGEAVPEGCPIVTIS